MYVSTIQHLNYSGQESKKQFAVYDSDTPVTLKQSQGHQSCKENVDTLEGYNHAKFERCYIKSMKNATKVFSNDETSQSSPLNMWGK